MRSEAQTVEEYLQELPPVRREAITSVRETILQNLPAGYVEVMNWGMITYEVPLEESGPTYNKKPLMYAALASQKNHMAVYLCAIYCISDQKEAVLKAYEEAGLKLDMGASCIRFKSLDKLHLPAIAASIAATPMAKFIQLTKRD